MTKTVLVTGATSGIGYELCKLFANDGNDLVLVARNRQRLETVAGELEDRYHIRVMALAIDLSQSTAPQEVYERTRAAGTNIDVLVNNAGMGINGKFTDATLEQHTDLMQLNIVSMTNLCKLFATVMVKSGAGSILNVASTAAFQPGPYMSVYYASKAYVLMFSEGLNRELRHLGVNVTALCPGPTKTDFFNKAGMSNSILLKSPQAMNATQVARIGYKGLMKRKAVIIPGIINKLMTFSIRLMPRNIITGITAQLNQR